MSAKDMRTIKHLRGTLHIETEQGIINIRAGLSDNEGRKVDVIEIIPDNYAGESKVTLDGSRNNQLIRED